MAESLFDIFGDSINKQSFRNGSRQQLSNNNENLGTALPGKMVHTLSNKMLNTLPNKKLQPTPVKPNEPVKRIGELKKSFLSNTGLSIQGTPMRQALTPRAVNVTPMIYNDKKDKYEDIKLEELEFTKPSFFLDNYKRDIFDYFPLAQVQIREDSPTPLTPSPTKKRRSMEFNCSYSDDFFMDDFSNDSIPDTDLDLPDIY